MPVNKDELGYRTHATMCNNTEIDCESTYSSRKSSCPNQNYALNTKGGYTLIGTTECINDDNYYFCNKSKTCVGKGIHFYAYSQKITSNSSTII